MLEEDDSDDDERHDKDEDDYLASAAFGRRHALSRSVSHIGSRFGVLLFRFLVRFHASPEEEVVDDREVRDQIERLREHEDPEDDEQRADRDIEPLEEPAVLPDE